jgi:hypothetical protein
MLLRVCSTVTDFMLKPLVDSLFTTLLETLSFGKVNQGIDFEGVMTEKGDHNNKTTQAFKDMKSIYQKGS